MRTTKELTQLAKDVRADKVFFARRKEEVQSAFGTALTLLPETVCEQMTKDRPQTLYEYLDKAEPSLVNGYPSFLSFHWLSAEEWPLFCTLYLQHTEGSDATQEHEK